MSSDSIGSQRRRRTLVLATAFASAGIVAALLCWFVVSWSWSWTDEATVSAVGLAGGLGGAFGAVFGQPLFDKWLSDKTAISSQLDVWQDELRTAVLKRRVRGRRAQLERMLRRGAVVDQNIRDQVMVSEGPMGQPRLRISGRVLPLSQLVEEWDKDPGRLVIIGDPGYGKTVAALTLVAHINQTERPSGVVAELFTLADWSRWARDHPDGELEGWFADELAATYGGLGVKVAQALVESGRILPLLDGLDEDPEDQRQHCRDSIEVYAGRATSRRPFVLTSRVAEYAAMAPNLVSADREAVLVGFSKEQALEALHSRTTAIPGWDAVRRSFEEGDAVLAKLFRSPLRLSVALQAYETGGADELLQDTTRAPITGCGIAC